MNSIQAYNHSFVREIINNLQNSTLIDQVPNTQGLTKNNNSVSLIEFYKNKKDFADRMLNYDSISKTLACKLENFIENITSESSLEDIKILFEEVQNSVPMSFCSHDDLLSSAFIQINSLIKEFHEAAQQNTISACKDIAEKLKYFIPIKFEENTCSIFLSETNKYDLLLANANVIAQCDAEAGHLIYLNDESIKLDLPSIGIVGAYKDAFEQTDSRFSELHYTIAQLATIIDSLFITKFQFSGDVEPNFKHNLDSFSRLDGLALKINHKWEPASFHNFDAIFIKERIPLMINTLKGIKVPNISINKQQEDYNIATDIVNQQIINDATKTSFEEKRKIFKEQIHEILYSYSSEKHHFPHKS